MNYRFGAVVLVPFPFTDQSASKQRPAVVVSSAAYHASRADLKQGTTTREALIQSSHFAKLDALCAGLDDAFLH